RRFGKNAHRRLDDDTQQALGAGNDTEDIEPVRSRRFSTDDQALATGQRDLDAEQVVGGQSIFQTVQAAGILRDVAAEGARDLARRIWRVVEAMRFDS